MNALSVSHVSPASFEYIVRGPYTIASRGCISPEHATGLVQLLRGATDTGSRSVLGGRGQTLIHELPSLGRIFVKRYSHGGLLRALTGGMFIGIGTCRSQAEFEMLERVREYGVNAPQPYAFINKGAALYSTWLVMEELAGVQSLAEINPHHEDKLHEAMKELAGQMQVLIKHRILHVDLHPGNVLRSSSGKVFIVDFDKAYVFRGGSRLLREIYLRRWRRAVIKHELPPLLSELMSLTLRSYDD